MDFSKYLDEKCIHIGFNPSNKNDVIEEIARLCKQNPVLESISQETLIKKLLEREQLSSTALSNKVAIPHCKIAGLKEFVIGIVTVPEGIDYHSLDGKLTEIFVFIIAPEEERNSHLRILSNISMYLKEDHNIVKILSTKNAKDLRNSFIKHTFYGNQIETEQAHNLFHVFIQNEVRFNDILEIFTEKTDSHVVVVDAVNASNYLYKMPLFSSFWSDSSNKFSRIIIGVIPRLKALNAIQQIKNVIKEEGEVPGIMVTMHELAYFTGKLDI